MRILAIETSCDETGVAIIEGKGDKIRVVKNLIASQIALHRKTGGVVPEVAARAHLEKLLPMIKECVGSKSFRTGKNIDAIAVTSGPGLITALLVGVETAKTLALLWNKPLIGTNHMAGHIYASLIDREASWKFPVLALAVSGGHTELVLLKKHNSFHKIGETVDDAAGEAFDKVAKILKLPYPGGPVIEKLAYGGNPKAFDFPRPMIKSNDFNFSFSGLKTAVLYTIQKRHKIRDSHRRRGSPQAARYEIQDVCASFQQAVVDVLVSKTVKATEQYHAKTVCLVGGVASNTFLRKTLKEKLESLSSAPLFLVPEKKYCVDNAAMIGAAAYHIVNSKLLLKSYPWKNIEADANWELPK